MSSETTARGMRGRASTWFGAALAIFLMEPVVRQVYQVPVSHEEGFGTIIRPGATVRWRREGHGESHWTHFGIRGAEPPDLSKHPVLVLGNSFTEALQVDDDEAFTWRVQRRLARAGIPPC
jgi:hypothetical protein